MVKVRREDKLTGIFTSLADAIGAIPDGASLAVTKFNPMAAIREWIRQRRKNLHLIGVPTAGVAVDLLVAAGFVASAETGAFVLGNYGTARNCMRAIEDGGIRLIDSACPLIEMQLRAGAAGLPFTPVPGLIGSDLLAQRPELKIIDNPYDPGFEIVIAPALRPDFAIIHALRADEDGNVMTTIHNEERLIVQAAQHSIATVEQVRPDALQALAADEQVIPALYFNAVVAAPGGALPFACRGYYGEDKDAVRSYLAASREAESMTRYLQPLRETGKAAEKPLVHA